MIANKAPGRERRALRAAGVVELKKIEFGASGRTLDHSRRI